MEAEDISELDEYYEEEVVFDISKLSEEELTQLLSQSGQNDELFGVPTSSIDILFLSFLQNAVKSVISLLTFNVEFHDVSTVSIKLDYALDMTEKLVAQAGLGKLQDLSKMVLLQHPEFISVLLHFALDVWQGV